MATCIHCEARNSESSRYCTNCGRPIAGIQQTESQLVAGEGELRCHSCGSANLKRSVFCHACGYYLKKRAYVAILLLMTSATVIAALIILIFEEGWFWQLVVALLIGVSALRWILIGFFGWRGERYEEWKAQRRKKRDLAGKSL